MEKRKRKDLNKYFLFFKRETKELYAYTGDKIIADSFRTTRKESLFYEKIQEIDKEDSKDLFYEKSECLLEIFEFKYLNMTIPLPITKLERITMDNVIHKAILVDIPMCAKISPEIFRKEYQKILNDVGYTAIHKNSDLFGIGKFDLNYFQCFLNLYHETLKGKEDLQ